MNEVTIGVAEDFPHASGISDFWPKLWTSWLTVLYEDLINDSYYLLKQLPGYEDQEHWELR